MYLVIVLQLLLFLASGKPCTPFGPRMSLGSSYFGGSKEIFRLLFNTNEECNKSYIQINQNVVSNITCEVKPLLLQTLNFSTFIHNCSVGGVVLGKDFEYNVIGVTDDDIEIKFSDSPIVTSLVDPKVTPFLFRKTPSTSSLFWLTGQKSIKRNTLRLTPLLTLLSNTIEARSMELFSMEIMPMTWTVTSLRTTNSF